MSEQEQQLIAALRDEIARYRATLRVIAEKTDTASVVYQWCMKALDEERA